ncbi:MAG: undecaprenyl-diphosphate phosphatase [Acidobacteriota bacterium]
MTPIQALLLGLIQGVTEFLPISSSAHLILVPYLLGWEEHGLRFDVVTNAGTLLAAVIYFRSDLLASAREILAGGPSPVGQRFGLGWAVVLGSVPVVVAALLFYDWIATVARNPVVIATSSIVFGLLLWWADRLPAQRPLSEITWRDSLWIGAAQAVALIPGTSRSGITITAGLWRGIDRFESARFSFLLAIPVGVLALAKDVLGMLTEGLGQGELGPLLIGFVTSGVSAYLVIDWLLKWLRRQKFTPFVIYRVALGCLILAVVWAS